MFAVLSVAAPPEHLRGYISRFLQETVPDLFVGKLNPVVWDRLWDRVLHERNGGKA